MYSVLWLMVYLLHFVRLWKMSVGMPLAPALYVFGDSLFDNGNNNVLPTFARADFLPYGINFARGVTGRFTNGRTVADFIAEYLGLPYPPPYMSMQLSMGHNGFNYASGSCGILPQTGSQYGKCLNLKEQVDLFERTVESDLWASSNGLSKKFLSESIFLFSIGNNDFLTNYLQRPNTTFASTNRNNADSDAQSFAQNLVDSLAQQFERLYILGARKVIMFEIGPIGCIPSFVKRNKEKGKCVEEINELATYFNQRLGLMLKNLASSLEGSTFVLGRANWVGYDAINNPSKYGFKESRNPCCTTWRNGTSSCIPWLRPCSEAYSYYFWDAFHMTEAVCSLIAYRCFNDSSVCSPSIYQLLQS